MALPTKAAIMLVALVATDHAKSACLGILAGLGLLADAWTTPVDNPRRHALWLNAVFYDNIGSRGAERTVWAETD